MTAALSIALRTPPADMPDADTDCLIFIKGQTEATLGAYVGHSGDLAIWVDAQGDPCEVDAWAELPVRSAL